MLSRHARVSTARSALTLAWDHLLRHEVPRDEEGPSCSYDAACHAPRRWAATTARRKRATTAGSSEPAPPGASSSSSGGSSSGSERDLAVQLAIAEMNKKLGQGTIMPMGGASPRYQAADACLPTGSLLLDVALGGGWPKGKIVEVFGPESSGKTTLALHAIRETQRRGGTALLIDAEHAYNEPYAASIGVSTERFFICQPQTGDDALQVVDRLARSGGVDLIVVDSVAALVPRCEVEGDVGAPTIGAQARLMSSSLRRLVSSADRMGCTVLFLNQLRHKVGVIFGNPEVTSGGNALKFYASARVDLRRTATVTGSGDEPVGIRVRAKVVKNKCARPYRVAEFDVLFEGGINAALSLLDAAEQCGVVTRRGSFYYHGATQLGQGKDRALAAMAEDPALQGALEQAVKAALAAGHGHGAAQGPDSSSSSGVGGDSDGQMAGGGAGAEDSGGGPRAAPQ